MLFVSMLTIGTVQVSGQDDNPDAVFEITVMAPNTNPARNTWSALIADTLPKIGIGVKSFENVGWDVLGPRTYAHPADGSTPGYAPGELPTYDDGGFDIFFVGWSGTLDYDPLSIHSSVTWSPTSDNMAHYSNATVDAWMEEYAAELDPVARVPIAKKIQQALAYQLPYIPLINTAGLWAYSDAITSDVISDDDWLMLSVTAYQDGWKNIEAGGPSTLTYAHSYELTEFTPFVINSYIAAQYLNSVFAALFERDVNDPNKAYKPMLANAEPVWNADNTVATIDINPAATFSNGNPVTAADVVNTYRMHLTPAVGSTSYGTLTAFLKADANGDYNSSISAVDADTVKFEFDRPYFLAPELMAYLIYDDAVIGTPDAPAEPDFDFNSDPLTYSIGAGPFVLDSYSATSHNVKVVKRADYWNGAVKLDAIEFNKYGDKEAALAALKSGEVQIIDPQMYLEKTEVENEAGVSYKILADFGTQMITVNMQHPILGTGVDTPLGKDDPARAAEAANYIRLAISHIVPRDEIVNEIVKGLGTQGTTLWPDVAAGYDTSLVYHPYDVEKAKEYMAMAGYDSVTGGGFLPLQDFLPMFLASMMFATVIVVRKRK
jgi:ABC-type transport system substrate-binding protein